MDKNLLNAIIELNHQEEFPEGIDRLRVIKHRDEIIMINKSLDIIALYSDYLKELLNSTQNEELYLRYKGKFQFTSRLKDYDKSLSVDFKKQFKYNLPSPFNDLISKCIRDLSLVTPNIVLIGLFDLLNSVYVYNNNKSGFYFINSFKDKNITLNLFVSYICYFANGSLTNTEYYSCCMDYAFNYLREERSKNTLLKILGFERINKLREPDNNDYMYIKVLNGAKGFQYYKRYDPIKTQLYQYCNEKLKHDISNSFEERKDLENTQQYILLYNALKYYQEFLNEGKKVASYTNTSENFENYRSQNVIMNDIEQLNTVLSDNDIFNSVSKEIEKNFIKKIKQNTTLITNIKCYINKASCLEEHIKYLVDYDEQKDVSHRFTLKKIDPEDILNQSTVSMDSSTANDTILSTTSTHENDNSIISENNTTTNRDDISNEQMNTTDNEDSDNNLSINVDEDNMNTSINSSSESETTISTEDINNKKTRGRKSITNKNSKRRNV